MLTISKDCIEQSGLTTQEFLLLLYASNPDDSIEETLKSLWNKGYLCKDVDKYTLCVKGSRLLKEIIAKSKHMLTPCNYTELELRIFAQELIDLYPSGGLEGNGLQYQSNATDVITALKNFFNVYGNYPLETVKEATIDYIESFEGDYTYIRLLKNFIFKIDSTNDCSSVLMDYIENKE